MTAGVAGVARINRRRRARAEVDEVPLDLDRPSVQYEESDGSDDGIWTIRASAFGGCMRSMVATGRGIDPMPPPDWMQEKYDQGHAAEETIEQLAMAELGHGRWAGTRRVMLKFLRSGLSFDDGASMVVVVEGTVDNLSLDMGRKFDSDTEDWHPDLIHEYKALGPSYVAKIEKLGPEPAWRDVLKMLPAPYAWQVSIYMHGIAVRYGRMIPMALVVGAKNDAGEVERILPIVMIDEPPYTLTEIAARAKLIVDMIEADGDDAWPACDEPKQYPCGHYFLHDDDEVPEVDEADRERFRLACDAIDTAKILKDRADAMKKDANAVIRDVMKGRKKVLLPAVCDRNDVAELPEISVTWVKRDVKERVQTIRAHVQEYPKINRTKVKENK